MQSNTSLSSKIKFKSRSQHDQSQYKIQARVHNKREYNILCHLFIKACCTILQCCTSISRQMKYRWISLWNQTVKGHLEGLTEQLWEHFSIMNNFYNWMHHLFHVDFLIPHLAQKGQKAFWTFLLMTTNKLNFWRYPGSLGAKLHGNMAKSALKILIPFLTTHMCKSIIFHYSI